MRTSSALAAWAAWLLLHLLPFPALGQSFSTASTSSNVATAVTSTYRYDFTTAAATATHRDVSACTALTASFNASTGDASNVARVVIQACPAAASPNQDCVPYALPNDEFTVARPITPPPDKAFVRVRVVTAPTGGDTARVELVCTSSGSQSTAGLGGGVDTKEADVQVGDGDIVTLDFGAGFDLAESPDTEVQILPDMGEIAAGGALPSTYGGTGQDASSYTGVLGLTDGAAVPVTTKAELETQLGGIDLALGNGDTLTGAYDLGGAVLELPNGTSGTTDADGECYLDTNGDGGTHFSGPVLQCDAGASVRYGFLIPLPDAGTDDSVPTYDSTSKTVTWEAGGGGGGAFDDTGDPIVANTTTKDLALGAAQINSAKLSVDGDADQVQLAIQGHSTQTNNPFEIENSAGTIVFSVSNTGAVVGAGGFTSTATASPCFSLDDSDSASETTDAQVCAQATDTGNGSEDVDLTFNVQVAGVNTTRGTIDADDETRFEGGLFAIGNTGTPGVSTADGDLFVEDALEVDGVSNLAGAVTLGVDLTVPNGGTGASTFTDGGVLLGAGTSAVTATAVLTAGQLLIGDGTTAPAIAAMSGDALMGADGVLAIQAGAINALTDIAAGLKSGADATLITGTEGANGNCAQWDANGDLVDAGASCASGTGDSVSVDGGATTDPNLASTGDIDVVNTSNTVTFNINGSSIVAADHANADWGDGAFSGGTFTIDANAITAAKIATLARYINWGAGSFTSDGSSCVGPTASVIVASSARQYSVVCADGGTFYGTTTLPPDLDDTGDITFTLQSIRPSGGTALAGDFSYQCFSDDAAIGGTWQTGAAADDTLTTANDLYAVTTAGIDIETACAPGDALNWRYVIDSANHDASAAALINVRMAYVANPQ